MSRRLKILAALNVIGWLVAVPLLVSALIGPFVGFTQWPSPLGGGGGSEQDVRLGGVEDEGGQLGERRSGEGPGGISSGGDGEQRASAETPRQALVRILAARELEGASRRDGEGGGEARPDATPASDRRTDGTGEAGEAGGAPEPLTSTIVGETREGQGSDDPPPPTPPEGPVAAGPETSGPEAPAPEAESAVSGTETGRAPVAAGTRPGGGRWADAQVADPPAPASDEAVEAPDAPAPVETVVPEPPAPSEPLAPPAPPAPPVDPLPDPSGAVRPDEIAPEDPAAPPAE